MAAPEYGLPVACSPLLKPPVLWAIPAGNAAPVMGEGLAAGFLASDAHSSTTLEIMQAFPTGPGRGEEFHALHAGPQVITARSQSFFNFAHHSEIARFTCRGRSIPSPWMTPCSSRATRVEHRRD